jgi:hypothetical protein
MATLLVAALRDAIRYNTRRIDETEVGDVSSLEEYLVQLGNLEAEVRVQYEREQKKDSQMLPYEDVWGPEETG